MIYCEHWELITKSEFYGRKDISYSKSIFNFLSIFSQREEIRNFHCWQKSNSKVQQSCWYLFERRIEVINSLPFCRGRMYLACENKWNLKFVFPAPIDFIYGPSRLNHMRILALSPDSSSKQKPLLLFPTSHDIPKKTFWGLTNIVFVPCTMM